MSPQPAARVEDPIAHTLAMRGALMGLAAGALIGVAAVATVATAGLGTPLLVMAVGGAIATTGGAGMAGSYIGESMPGPVCGMIKEGSADVFINGKGAARSTLTLIQCAQHSPLQLEATGSGSVFINGMPAGRVGEKAVCSAVITEGSSNVFIGGPQVATETMKPEVPRALSITMQAMAIGGTIVATGGSIVAFGAMATGGAMALGFVGGWAGGIGGRWAAAKMGFGETGQRIGETLGGIGGGALGGFAGFKGGQRLGGRRSPIPVDAPDPPPRTPPAGSGKPSVLPHSKPANDNHTRVGRWMSEREYNEMVRTGKVQEGSGGLTFAATDGPDSFRSQTQSGNVYVEYDVPTNSVLKGGKEGWVKTAGPNAGRSQQRLLEKRGGTVDPDAHNISGILDRKP